MLAGTKQGQNIKEPPLPRALTVAGSDSGGGAGIQADLKVFTSLGVYGMSVITAVTSQNTVAVKRVDTLPPEAVACQLQAVLEDIGTDALKTGMLANGEIIETVCQEIIARRISCLVVDPVMVAKSGDLLLESDAVAVLREKLLPLTMVFTPNIPEAEALLRISITTVREMEDAAKRISDLGPKWVVLKGGHLVDQALDVVFDGRQLFHLEAERIKTNNTHGTGCTFSALITALLAREYGTEEAIRQAKRLLTWGIEHSLQLGSGHGPTNHFYFLRSTP